MVLDDANCTIDEQIMTIESDDRIRNMTIRGLEVLCDGRRNTVKCCEHTSTREQACNVNNRVRSYMNMFALNYSPSLPDCGQTSFDVAVSAQRTSTDADYRLCINAITNQGYFGYRSVAIIRSEVASHAIRVQNCRTHWQQARLSSGHLPVSPIRHLGCCAVRIVATHSMVSGLGLCNLGCVVVCAARHRRKKDRSSGHVGE